MLALFFHCDVASRGGRSPRSSTLVRYSKTLYSTFSCELSELSNIKCESLADDLDHSCLIFSDKTACATAACSKSPRSRAVKRTNFGSSFSCLSCSWYGFPNQTVPMHNSSIARAFPRSSISPFSPPCSPTCPSTSGHAGTPRRSYPSLACSPSPRRVFPLRSSPSPGCSWHSLARGARRLATSSGVLRDGCAQVAQRHLFHVSV